jgi:protein-S-isoprenylcysteine O-methyltransferase Ste14
MAPDRAGGAALGIAVPALLVRMRRDFDARGGFTRSTATAMWGCYGIGGALYVHALLRGRPAPASARAVGLAASAAGVAAVAVGMDAFNSAAQLTGTDPGTLHERGAYRYSRNPQYAGFVLAGAGGALARCSVPAAVLTAGYAATCAWWVRVEERNLRRTFGDEYARYQRRAARWFGRPAPQPS